MPPAKPRRCSIYSSRWWPGRKGARVQPICADAQDLWRRIAAHERFPRTCSPAKPRTGKVVNAFQESEGAGVFLLSLRAAGTGLNLTTASYVVLYDPWWNPAVEAQAIDRTHRIGQTKTVNAYKLIAPGTVERKSGTSNRTNAKLSPTCSARKGLPRASTRRIWNSCSARIGRGGEGENGCPAGTRTPTRGTNPCATITPRDNREGRKVARAAAQAKRKLHRDPRRSISGAPSPAHPVPRWRPCRMSPICHSGS